jgi:glc operon protein GlcG
VLLLKFMPRCWNDVEDHVILPGSTQNNTDQIMSAPPEMSKVYGSPISLENAKKACAAAVTEASSNHWNMAIAIVDPAGTLVYYEKMDDTQLGSANVALDKARSAALFKRPTQVFQNVLSSGNAGLSILAVQGAVPVAGGVPLMMEGKIVGAIGISGDSSENDHRCAEVGAKALR